MKTNTFTHCFKEIVMSWPTGLAALLLVVGSFVTSSCGTARGFGSDVEKTGEKIEDAASR